jgi:hypothetical protein
MDQRAGKGKALVHRSPKADPLPHRHRERGDRRLDGLKYGTYLHAKVFLLQRSATPFNVEVAH